MTTTIRGKSGKSSLRELLDQHDQCVALIESAKRMVEPLMVCGINNLDEEEIQIAKDELVGILQARLQVINTKLENLGLKIGDEVMENSQ